MTDHNTVARRYIELWNERGKFSLVATTFAICASSLRALLTQK